MPFTTAWPAQKNRGWPLPRPITEPGPSSHLQGLITSGPDEDKVHINGRLTMDHKTIEKDVSTNGVAHVKHSLLKGCLSTNGVTTLNEVQLLGQAEFNGTTTMTRVDATQPMTSEGSLTAKQCTLGKGLTAKGKLTATNCTIIGPVAVRGTAKLQDSTLTDTLELTAKGGVAATLHSTDTRDIVVKQPESDQAGVSQTLELTGRSVVNGDIRFEGGHGRVLLDPGVRLSGEVFGGQVIRQPVPWLRWLS